MIYRLGTAMTRPFLWAPKPPPYRRGPAAQRAAAGIGRRLRRARLVAGLSHAALGALIGVAAATVRHYEAGRRMPPARLAAAALVLGFPLSWFIREDDTPEAAPRDED
jgi:ribosome-binding protein aMBF1 (putative translation factor)